MKRDSRTERLSESGVMGCKVRDATLGLASSHVAFRGNGAWVLHRHASLRQRAMEVSIP